MSPPSPGDGDNFIHRSLADSYEKRRQLGRSFLKHSFLSQYSKFTICLPAALLILRFFLFFFFAGQNRALQILYMPTGFLDPEIARSPDVPGKIHPTFFFGFFLKIIFGKIIFDFKCFKFVLACGPTSIDKNVQMAFYALQSLAPDFQGLALSTKCAGFFPHLIFKKILFLII